MQTPFAGTVVVTAYSFASSVQIMSDPVKCEKYNFYEDDFIVPTRLKSTVVSVMETIVRL